MKFDLDNTQDVLFLIARDVDYCVIMWKDVPPQIKIIKTNVSERKKQKYIFFTQYL